jgi:excisionase family DNA binding protein
MVSQLSLNYQTLITMEQVTLITISLDELKKVISEAVQEALSNYEKHQTFPEFPESRSVNLETLCKLYNWKKPTVYGWVSERSIPNCKVGRLLYFNLTEIEKWIASRKRKTVAEIELEASEYLIQKRGRE